MNKKIWLKINGLDVWGNSDDGYEINDVLGSHGVIEVNENADDAEIITALVDQGIIYAGGYALDHMGDDNIYCNLIDPEDDRPILQIEARGPYFTD